MVVLYVIFYQICTHYKHKYICAHYTTHAKPLAAVGTVTPTQEPALGHLHTAPTQVSLCHSVSIFVSFKHTYAHYTMHITLCTLHYAHYTYAHYTMHITHLTNPHRYCTKVAALSYTSGSTLPVTTFNFWMMDIM